MGSDVDVETVADASSQRKLGVVISYLYIAIQAVIGIAYVPLLLSSIGQEEYGLYRFVGSLAAYIVSINSVLSAGVSRYYCMYVAKRDSRNAENTLAISKRIYWAASGVGVLLFAGIAVGIHFVYSGSFTPVQLAECSVMLMLTAANLVVTMNNTINIAAITAHERFVFLKGTQLATLIVQPVIVLVLAQFWPNAVVTSVAVLSMNVLCATLQRVYAHNALKIKYTYHGWDKDLARGLLKFSTAVLLATIADQIFWNTDQLILGYMYGAGAVAVYGIGSQIYMSYMPLGTTVSGVFLPHVSELYHKNDGMEAISKLFIKVGRLAMYILLLVLLGFAIFGQEFIQLWAGPQYDDAFWVALIVMAPFTIDLVQNLGIVILQAADKYYFRGTMYLVIAIMNVGLTVVLVNTMGMVGAAVSTGIAFFLGNGLIMNWYYAEKMKLDIWGFWTSLIRLAIPPIVMAAVFGVAWHFFEHQASWLVLLAGLTVFTLAYCTVAWLFSANDEERLAVRSLVSKVFK